ncbi:flavin reductase family protein [Pararhodobacter aggregans]|uniref:Flavin reductase like domain-containing protein n=1 Tax=Pararhodobacter aggregans TaxID=404875 RepID=A0A2T7UKW0_9RHOB|nr:flavin reductase family protein [Pararhodobacter aggregans]PTX02367.1 flavin reductase (DIM6/NTAB) family NADH-FMN oxidoreductase RutF [Pararhodobacter aggregans]PVE45313.1 hypothetical protein DDE23_22345 [Pararhodobacter aggregans]
MTRIPRADPAPLPLTAAEDRRTLLRTAYGRFPSGVVAIAAMDGDRPICMVASSFVAVSMEPALVAFCVQWTSKTWSRLNRAPRLGISVLGDGQDGAARRLASRDESKFDGIGHCATAEGAVFIEGAAAWFDCSIANVLDAGDHGFVLLTLDSLSLSPSVEPLVFHASEFRRLGVRNLDRTALKSG